MMLPLVALGFLVLLLMGKILTVLEVRSQNQRHRNNQRQIAQLEEDLDTSRRKYLIALKAEGVAKHKRAHLKTRYASLKQHLDQIEVTVAQQEAREEKELEHKLEVLVMKALGGPSVRRDSHFKRVMSVIKQLIDIEKQGSSEDVIAAVQEKLAEMGKTGVLTEAAGDQPAGPPGEGQVADGAQKRAPDAADTPNGTPAEERLTRTAEEGREA